MVECKKLINTERHKNKVKSSVIQHSKITIVNIKISIARIGR